MLLMGRPGFGLSERQGVAELASPGVLGGVEAAIAPEYLLFLLLLDLVLLLDLGDHILDGLHVLEVLVPFLAGLGLLFQLLALFRELGGGKVPLGEELLLFELELLVLVLLFLLQKQLFRRFRQLFQPRLLHIYVDNLVSLSIAFGVSFQHFFQLGRPVYSAPALFLDLRRTAQRYLLQQRLALQQGRHLVRERTHVK